MELELRSIKPAACCRRGLRTCVQVMGDKLIPVSRTSSCFPPPESQAVSGCAGPKRCHARVPIARAPRCCAPRSRRPKQASLGRPETSSRCEITISHCIRPQAASTPQSAPRRAPRRSPRAHDPRPRRPRPRRPEKERSCLFNVAQAPFCCLRLPGGQRGLLRREDGYDGCPPSSVNVVVDCASDLGAPEAILPLAAAG